MAVRVSNDYIRSFTGEGDFVGWLTKVKLVARLQKITDLSTFIPLYLEGNALSIYLEMGESEQADAKKIEERLKEVFTDGPFIAHRKLVSTSWSGEQVDVYANEIRRLAGLAGFTGENLEKMVKLTFVNGFPDSVGVELQQVENVLTLTMSDLLTRARILCANKSGGAVAAVAKNITQSKQPLQGGAKVGETAARKFKGQCYSCGGPHMARFCRERKGVVCFRCGIEGHISTQCDQNQGNDRKGGMGPVCFNCGIQGHIATQCDQNQGNDKRGAVAPAATPSKE